MNSENHFGMKAKEMSVKKTSKKYHKWLGLFLSIQFAIWLITGLYMVIIPIDYIHGDHLIRPVEEALTATDLQAVDMDELRHKFPETEQIEILKQLGKPYAIIDTEKGVKRVDLTDLSETSPIDEAMVRTLAHQHYAAGDAPILAVNLLTDIPGEIRGRQAPIWQVIFDDGENGTLYFSPISGKLMGKRHDFWRAYDFLWMFHIMDYETRDNINTLLLRLITSMALIAVLAGAVLGFYALKKKSNPKIKRRYGMNQMTFRLLHKWLGITIGLQLIIWTGSGLLMSMMDQNDVKGRTLSEGLPYQAIAHNSGPLAPLAPILAQEANPVYSIQTDYLMDGPIYKMTTSTRQKLYDAQSGQPHPITADLAAQIAEEDYHGDIPTNGTQLIDHTGEAKDATAPVWRVAFDDAANTRLYINSHTGKIENRYNDKSAIFDFLWMLHMMDYAGEHSFNNGFIIFVGAIGFWLVLSGILLLFGVFRRKDFRILSLSR